MRALISKSRHQICFVSAVAVSGQRALKMIKVDETDPVGGECCGAHMHATRVESAKQINSYTSNSASSSFANNGEAARTNLHIMLPDIKRA
jgi:hypothetical protein